MSHTEHKEHASRLDPIRCAILTISDTRTEEDDRSGSFMHGRLERAGHQIVFYDVLPDEPAQIGPVLDALTQQADVVLLNGGTGISARDRTFEAVSSRLEKTLPGFGELFRMLSFEEIGASAMLSRAVAGLYRETILFSCPGSLPAVKLAMDRLILPELKHLVWEVVRQR